VTAPAYDGGRPEIWAVVIRLLDLAVHVLGGVRVTGSVHVPPRGGALIAANHVSHLDPLVLLVVAHRCGRKLRLMGVQEAFEQPVIGALARAGRHIPVVQGSSSRAPLKAAEAALRAGELVLVYPEGTVPGDGVDVAAKGGVGLLALRAQVPVVPLRSRGLERGTGARWRPWRRPSASVAFGPPVQLPDVPAPRPSVRYADAGDAVLAAIREL
jgi:1-acyl-sn-glycerol-3-phosphate acyltransferase